MPDRRVVPLVDRRLVVVVDLLVDDDRGVVDEVLEVVVEEGLDVLVVERDLGHAVGAGGRAAGQGGGYHQQGERRCMGFNGRIAIHYRA